MVVSVASSNMSLTNASTCRYISADQMTLLIYHIEKILPLCIFCNICSAHRNRYSVVTECLETQVAIQLDQCIGMLIYISWSNDFTDVSYWQNNSAIVYIWQHLLSSQKLLCYCSSQSVWIPKLLLGFWLITANSISWSISHASFQLNQVVR